MPYSIRNTRNTVVATVQDLVVDTSTPMTLIGKGLAGYGQAVARDFYQLMENFANTTPPNNPAEGMTWYNSTTGQQALSYWDGSNWNILSSSGTSSAGQLSRMPAASSINFLNSGSTSIYTGPTGRRTMVTGVLLIPATGASVTTTNPPPSFQLEVAAGSSDVCDRIIMNNLTSASSFAFYNVAGVNRIVQPGDVVKIVIDQTVAPGDTLTCDVYLFGTVRT